MKRRIFLLALCLFVLTVPASRADEADATASPWMGKLEPAPAGTKAPVGLTGFSPDSIESELQAEARAVAMIRPDSLRRHSRLLTEEPHVAGTAADYATAQYVQQRLTAYGWDARLQPIPVWLNWPKSVAIELLEPEPVKLAVREKGAAFDKDSHDANVFDAFNGYGASGDVTGSVVYANYGDVTDFQALRTLGIELKGRIAIVRYGQIFRGLKVRNAEKAGLAGVIIYSDPADDGYAQNDAFPRGPARPEDAIQRGSVQFLSEGPGDPTTPGWASSANGKRLPAAQAKGVPHIPSIPLSYGEAAKILATLGGPLVPKGWQGGLPFTYHAGPGAAKIHLKMEMDYAVRPIWNVIATLKGSAHPEQKVILGNHRDAWTYGAIDPNSGTICLLEMGRTLGALAKQGWRPLRTLELASWDGEEYGLLGSTEYAEGDAADLTAHAVAYVNVDAAVSGHDLRANGSHALRDLVAEAMRDVKDPGSNRPLWNVVVDRAWSEDKKNWAAANRARRMRNEPPRPFEWNVGPLGSGSDYTAFIDHLGVPSLEMSFGGLHGTYHSMYDDFEYIDRIVDPGFAYHVTMTDLWSRVAMRLGSAPVVPLRYSNTGQFAFDEMQSLEDRADDAGAGKPDSLRFTASLGAARAAAGKLRNAALVLERHTDAALLGSEPWPAGGADAVNAALMATERALLGPGLPGREWFRHELYAPGLNTGYAPVPLPRLGQAVLDNDPHAWAQGIAPIVQALERAAAELERVK